MNNKFDEQNDTVKFQFVGLISYSFEWKKIAINNTGAGF